MLGKVRDQIDFVLRARIHTMPRFFARRWQFWELRRLLQLAYEHVPFYKKFWDEHRVCPEDVRTLSDIRKFPITSKQLFRQYPVEEMMNTSFPAEGCKWVTTSGSTGEPFRFPVCKYVEYSRHNIFHTYRFLMWRGIKLNYLVKHLRVARISDVGESEDRRLFISRALFRNSPSEILRQLQEFKPDIVSSRPTILFELARLAEGLSARDRLRFKYLRSFGEMLYPEVRRFIENVIGGEVYDTYGLEETGSIAAECQMHDGFHINEESCVIEILDNSGDVLSEGNAGRIIVTRFWYNDAMPFIRYDTGDRGMIMPEPCPCGVRARRIRVFGREGLFIALGEKNYHLSEFEKIFEKLNSCIFRYQIVKTAPGLLEVRIIPTERFSFADENYIRTQFKERFDFTPRLRMVTYLDYGPSCKTPHFIDETKFTQ